MQMSESERIRASMLGDLGLTEQQYQAMTPADKAKVDSAIADRLKETQSTQALASSTVGTSTTATSNTDQTATAAV
jgi:hypothetical protein